MIAEGPKIQSRLDEALRLRALSVIYAAAALVIGFVVVYSGMIRQWFGTELISFAFLPLLFVLSCSIATYILASLQLKVCEEEEEKALLEKRKEKTALDVSEDVLFVSRRALDLYRKYSPYVICGLQFIAALVFLILYYRHIKSRVSVDISVLLANFAQAAFVSAVFAVICLFAGVFAVGQSRDRNFRWMRVSGSWLVMTAAIFAAGALSLLLMKTGRNFDALLRNIVFVLLSLTAIELFINFVMEFYRPRGEIEEKPVFESRLLGLFTEPGGLMKNIADTLDYQFGFKISGTWLYRFLEDSIIPLIIFWCASLWLMTCVTQIYPNELGVRETFGRINKGEYLQPGIHFKLPYPFGRIVRIPADDIQEIFVGTGKSDEDKKKDDKDSSAILWTVQHYEKEVKFLVASDKAVAETEVPVSYISSIFNIQYKIRKENAADYYYSNKDIRRIIQAISEGCITKFLAGKDMLKMLSMERAANQKELIKILQDAYDEAGLGIDVVFVNILDVHPPVERVAPAFQAVVGAIEEKEAEILNARAYENKTLPMAEAEAAKVKLDAETDSINTVTLARSENERFLKQMMAYRQMPSLFKLRTYLDFFENECAQVRKIVLDAEMAYNVFIMNFEEKQRLDLLDVSISEIAPKKQE